MSESLVVPRQKEPILETDSMEDENSKEIDTILEIDSIEDSGLDIEKENQGDFSAERKNIRASDRECEISDACSLPATQHIQIRVQWLPLESLQVLFYEAKVPYLERCITI